MSHILHPNHHREIENQALEFLHDYALTAYVFLAITHSALAAFIYHHINHKFVIIWIVIFLSIQTLTLICRRKLTKSQSNHEKKLKYGMFLNILEGFNVASCMIFFPIINEIMQMIITMVLLIACTGAITTTIGYQKFYLAFTLPILVTIIAVCIPLLYIKNGFGVMAIFSTASIMIIVVLYQLSKRIFHNFNETFKANIEILNINKELQTAVSVAKKANESKTRFLAAASHDLRQPINTLSLFVANLTLKDTSKEHDEIIKHMNIAINTIDSQLETLLDISKLDAGIVEINDHKIELISFLDDLVQSFQPNPNTILKYEPLASSLYINTDPILFERIINNLITNAIKYTNNGNINVKVSHQNGEASILIADTGIGIKKDQLDHVFDEFYQVDNRARCESKGLGLGLSIVKRLANLLKISTSISSSFGLGTEVLLTMEYESIIEKPKENFEEESTLISYKDLRIIVLDNDTNILNAMQSLLETMNHDAHVYSDFRKAIRCFEKIKFDIALIDYRISDSVFGDEIIKKMKNINNKTKFFLVTGDSNIDTNHNFEVIHKPVTSKKLEYIFDY